MTETEKLREMHAGWLKSSSMAHNPAFDRDGSQRRADDAAILTALQVQAVLALEEQLDRAHPKLVEGWICSGCEREWCECCHHGCGGARVRGVVRR